MHIKTRNVNTAFRTLVKMYWKGSSGIELTAKPSRYGDVVAAEEPFTITYERPLERVLLIKERDANPFFHLFEALWMLAGRNDVESLAYYNVRMREFSDDGVTLNGAYGYRWRKALAEDREGNLYSHPIDQLKIVGNHLLSSPETRRAVLQMWTVEDDLLRLGGGECMNCPSPAIAAEEEFQHGQHVTFVGGQRQIITCKHCNGTGVEPASKDVCCNLSVKFKLRPFGDVSRHPDRVNLWGKEGYFLDMTVFNRSNDLVWGTLGSDYVCFSVLQEYMAARVGAQVGVYHQVSDDLHVYVKTFEPEKWMAEQDRDSRTMFSPPLKDYPAYTHIPLVKDLTVFDNEVVWLTANYEHPSLQNLPLSEPFLNAVAKPMMAAFRYHKERQYEHAFTWCRLVQSDDWREAATDWIIKRKNNHDAKNKGAV